MDQPEGGGKQGYLSKKCFVHAGGKAVAKPRQRDYNNDNAMSIELVKAVFGSKGPLGSVVTKSVTALPDGIWNTENVQTSDLAGVRTALLKFERLHQGQSQEKVGWYAESEIRDRMAFLWESR